MTASNLLGNVIAGRLIKRFVVLLLIHAPAALLPCSTSVYSQETHSPRFKHYKIFAQIGVALGSAGFFLIAFRWQGHVNVGESLYVVLSGFGGGVLQAATFVAISTGSEESRKGAIVGFFFLVQELGALIGLSGSSTLIWTVFEHHLFRVASNVPNKDDVSALLASLIHSISVLTRFPQADDWQNIKRLKLRIFSSERLAGHGNNKFREGLPTVML